MSKILPCSDLACPRQTEFSKYAVYQINIRVASFYMTTEPADTMRTEEAITIMCGMLSSI